MSTRSQIGIYSIYNPAKPDLSQFDALLYRHSDGYPGTPDGAEYGVLADITPFLAWFDKTRGWDPEYLSARLLGYLMKKSDATLMKFKVKGARPSQFDIHEEFGGVLSFGICKEFYEDIQFFYAITEDRVDVFEVSGAGGVFTRIGTVDRKTGVLTAFLDGSVTWEKPADA